jgi:hypothetical protein
LHRVYYAQRDYRKAHGTFARSLADLGLNGLALQPRIETTANGFEASLPLSVGAGRRLVITHDAWIGER